MYTVVYMSAINDSIRIIHVEMKDQFTIPLRKHKFLRTVKNLNSPTVRSSFSKGCHNCCHHLSKYYYWKQSPCDSCSRSPMFHFRIVRVEVPDNWLAIMSRSESRKNILQS